MASKEANRLKYQYNKKYVEAYWNGKHSNRTGKHLQRNPVRRCVKPR